MMVPDLHGKRSAGTWHQPRLAAVYSSAAYDSVRAELSIYSTREALCIETTDHSVYLKQESQLYWSQKGFFMFCFFAKE